MAPVTPTGIPQPPVIRFLNRRLQAGGPALTILRWNAVSLDTAGFPLSGISSYYIYASTGPNLETMGLIKIVSSLDVNGNVDTCFSESNDGVDGSGYIQYGVAAVSTINLGDPGPMAYEVILPSNQLEVFG